MASSVTIVRITGAALVRAIPSARLREAALMPLVSASATLDDLAELESATNMRLVDPLAGLDITAAELLPVGTPGHSIVNAAFRHPRPAGNRFNNGRRGAWYAAPDIETCLQEVAFHMEREFANIGRFDAVDYAAIHADVTGSFATLDVPVGAPELDPDPKRGYPAGQALATQLRQAGHDGIIYPAARRAGHECVAVFTPNAISNIREGAVYRLAFAAGASPSITKLTA